MTRARSPADGRRLADPTSRRRVLIPVRVSEAERTLYEAAARELDVTLAETARAAWDDLVATLVKGQGRR